MIVWKCLSLLCLSALFTAVPPPVAFAQSSVSERPTEQCIGYREASAGVYRLFNECDYPVAVSWCSDLLPNSGDCARKLGWQNARVEPKNDVPGQYNPAQTINLFACRIPKTVEILTGGSGRCQIPAALDAPSALPILSAASLKNPAAIIQRNDYPTTVKDISGTSRFEMTVGADGKPISCSVTQSAGHPDLDNAACKAFLKRARFSPAKDAKGKATAGRYRGAINWSESE
jgi:TonB family protein